MYVYVYVCMCMCMCVCMCVYGYVYSARHWDDLFLTITNMCQIKVRSRERGGACTCTSVPVHAYVSYIHNTDEFVLPRQTYVRDKIACA